MEFVSINPADGNVIARYPIDEPGVVEKAVAAAKRSQADWSRRSISDRVSRLSTLGDVIRTRIDTLSRTLTAEMGKPIRESVAELEKCIWLCDYYADSAPGFLESTHIKTDAKESYVAFRPLGTVLGIMPWNFPFWQVFRYIIPALAAGNACLLKHAPNVPGCARAIQEAVSEAGFPEGIFRSLFVDLETTHNLIADSRISGVTLTGSTHAGREVAAAAGRSLKKIVLELGGSDPYVVLADADVEKAAVACVSSRLLNSGQSCIAAKRFVVVPEVASLFADRVRDLMEEKTVGNPMDPETDIGPLARTDLRDNLHRQVLESVAAGAELVIGGLLPVGPGAYYAPTILKRVGPGMPAYDEELFGPVASIVEARDESDAIRIANDTSYGLGAAVFTEDVERGKKIAEYELEAGSCFVNAFVKSDPRLPFGGIKDSGFGRELSGEGIREFTNVKTVYVEK